MREAWASAPGKVNLLLRVGPRSADGYHPLVTVFEAVGAREHVRARTTRAPGIHVRTFALEDGRAVPLGDFVPQPRHLAHRAARALQPLAQASWGPSAAGVRIDVVKTLPVAGGMAGGSADAAATLVALNAMWELGLTPAQLEQIGRGLGADVPACLRGGVSVGVGRGDRLAAVSPGVDGAARAPHHMAVAVSARGLGTPDVFAELDRRGGPSGAEAWTAPRPVTGALLERLCGPAPWRAASNDLRDAALALRPELADVARAGRDAGALGVVLTGSGPSLVGFASSQRAARQVADAWAGAPGVASVLVTWGPAVGARLEDALLVPVPSAQAEA